MLSRSLQVSQDIVGGWLAGWVGDRLERSSSSCCLPGHGPGRPMRPRGQRGEQPTNVVRAPLFVLGAHLEPLGPTVAPVGVALQQHVSSSST